MSAHEFTCVVECCHKIGVIRRHIDSVGRRRDKEFIPFLQGKGIGYMLWKNDAKGAAEFAYFQSVRHGCVV